MAHSTHTGAQPSDTNALEYSREVDKPTNLFMVYAAIIILTLVSVGLSSIGLGKFSLPIQLAIGSIQAGIVGFYFMHLRQGDRVVILTALSSIFWMMILFILFLTDYMTRTMFVP